MNSNSRNEELQREANAATELLKSKSVVNVNRPNGNEVLIEFDDGTRLYVNRGKSELDLSITSGPSK
jgi:hypothetical protein